MKANIILSAVTAFVISGGGSILLVSSSNGTLDARTWALAAVIGAVSAAKDIRSQLSIPTPPNPQ